MHNIISHKKNSDQNHRHEDITPKEWLQSKWQMLKIYLLGELFVENSEPWYNMDGTVKQCSHFGKQSVSYSND